KVRELIKYFERRGKLAELAPRSDKPSALRDDSGRKLEFDGLLGLRAMDPRVTADLRFNRIGEGIVWANQSAAVQRCRLLFVQNRRPVRNHVDGTGRRSEPAYGQEAARRRIHGITVTVISVPVEIPVKHRPRSRGLRWISGFEIHDHESLKILG